ncbi:HAMP domain-containing protein, partial [Lichenibacterium minor]
MAFLSNVGIKTKIIGMVLLTAAVAVGGAVYASFQIDMIDAGYSDLIAHDEAGARSMSRFNYFVTGYGYDLYKMESAVREDGDLASVAAEYDGLKARAAKVFAVARQNLPDEAAHLAEIEAEWKAIEGEADRAMAAATQHRDAEFFAGRASAVARITRLNNRNIGLIDQMSTVIDGKSGALTAQSRTTGTTTLLIMVGAALAMSAAALLMAARTITGPLGALRDAMGRLTEGRLDTAVPGLGRRDEVGQMAATVQRFKEDAVRARTLAADADAARHSADAERAHAEAQRADVARQQAEVVD